MSAPLPIPPPPIPPPPVPQSVPATVLAAEESVPAERPRSKRQFVRPNCPRCQGQDVKTLGGGTHGKYRYSCNACNVTWQQVPPHRQSSEGLPADGASEPMPGTVADVNTRKRQISQPYKCGRCGLPKKGHTCITGDGTVMPKPGDVSGVNAPIVVPCTAEEASATATAIPEQVISLDASAAGVYVTHDGGAPAVPTMMPVPTPPPAPVPQQIPPSMPPSMPPAAPPAMPPAAPPAMPSAMPAEPPPAVMMPVEEPPAMQQTMIPPPVIDPPPSISAADILPPSVPTDMPPSMPPALPSSPNVPPPSSFMVDPSPTRQETAASLAASQAAIDAVLGGIIP